MIAGDVPLAGLAFLSACHVMVHTVHDLVGDQALELHVCEFFDPLSIEV